MTKQNLQLCQHILETCASINLRRFSRLVTNEFNEALRPTGLRTTQLAVLVAIGAGDKQSLTDIANALSMDISTLTRSVAILEDKGLATCQAAGGRKKRVLLTSAGYKMVCSSYDYWKTAQEGFQHKLGKEICETLCNVVHNYRSEEKGLI